VEDTKIYGSGDTALLIFQVVTAGSQIVSFMRRPPLPEERTSGIHRIAEKLSKRHGRDIHRDSNRDRKFSNITAYVSKCITFCSGIARS
jgi:hypothetical protein